MGGPLWRKERLAEEALGGDEFVISGVLRLTAEAPFKLEICLGGSSGAGWRCARTRKEKCPS